MSCSVSIPKREGAVGRTLALMHLAVCSEVAPIDVAVERGADLRTIECRVEGRLQAVGGIGREANLPKTLVPQSGCTLAIAVEVIV